MKMVTVRMSEAGQGDKSNSEQRVLSRHPRWNKQSGVSICAYNKPPLVQKNLLSSYIQNPCAMPACLYVALHFENNKKGWERQMGLFMYYKYMWGKQWRDWNAGCASLKCVEIAVPISSLNTCRWSFMGASKDADRPASRAANNNSCVELFTAMCLSVCKWPPMKKCGRKVSRKEKLEDNRASTGIQSSCCNRCVLGLCVSPNPECVWFFSCNSIGAIVFFCFQLKSSAASKVCLALTALVWAGLVCFVVGYKCADSDWACWVWFWGCGKNTGGTGWTGSEVGRWGFSRSSQTVAVAVCIVTTLKSMTLFLMFNTHSRDFFFLTQVIITMFTEITVTHRLLLRLTGGTMTSSDGYR